MCKCIRLQSTYCFLYYQKQGWLWKSESSQAINQQWFKWWFSKVWHTKAVSALWIHFLLLLCFSTQETNNTTGSFAQLCCISWSLHYVWNQLKLGWKEQNTTDFLPTDTMERKRCWIQSSAKLAHVKHFIFDHVIKINILICII